MLACAQLAAKDGDLRHLRAEVAGLRAALGRSEEQRTMEATEAARVAERLLLAQAHADEATAEAQRVADRVVELERGLAAERDRSAQLRAAEAGHRKRVSDLTASR